MKSRKTTNEWEFQGQVVTWLNFEIERRPGLELDKATQEPSKLTPKRNDLVVWWNRNAESAFLTIELKTPETPITDPAFLSDACNKAQRWDAPVFAIWNMQVAELYHTPHNSRMATPADRIEAWRPDPLVLSVNDWLKPKPATSLRERAIEILDHSWQLHTTLTHRAIPIDASIFVDRIADRISRLQALILPVLYRETKINRALRKRIRAIAAAQGMIGIIDDFDAAITGQFTYRLIGQILFYLALRRKQPNLRSLQLSPSEIVPDAFRPYWDDVRRFDYEALFEWSDLDEIVPIPNEAQELIRQLITELGEYDWNSLKDDVLGAIFENLIPKEQQLLYGQFYTPPQVADLLVAFTVDGESPLILDPGCGSGTFLMRSYDFLHENFRYSHEKLLSLLWGFDISSFAAELAAINLFRQNLSAFDNFPRILRGNFFELYVGKEVPFPPAKPGSQDKVFVPIPKFDTVIGNPPYLRSQNQDDLDPDYKESLFRTAQVADIKAASKTDLFAFFIYRALEFMKPGSRIGFVTSSSWISADFGISLQRLLLDKLRLIALISSSAESFFSQVDVNAVLLIAEKRTISGIDKRESLRFVTLKKPLKDFFKYGHSYWKQITDFVDSVENAENSYENNDYRIKIVDADKENKKLLFGHNKPRNWSLYLRAPLSYFELFRDEDEPAMV